MSKTPMEKPLERLNYYNGMAVDAAGFKTEQDYHIRVRRWLNKSLYSAGIASGLDVRAAAAGPNVIVGPGLALDSEGREIILLEETTVEVCSYSGTNEATVVGNYLVIEYGEEAIAYEPGSCAVRTPGASAGKSTSYRGGPSRVQARPKFSWVPFVPPPGANQIVLARVELKAPNCDGVHQIDTGARRYVGAASAATVRQYALEGEREVAFIPRESFPTLPAPATQATDVEVVGRIYFHIRGRQPNSVTLYLRSEVSSSLHYTELGAHTHAASTNTALGDHTITAANISHVHDLSNVIADVEKDDDIFASGPNNLPPHRHWIFANILKPSQVFGEPGFNVGKLSLVLSPNLPVDPVLNGGTRTEVLDNDVIDTAHSATQQIVYGGDHRHRLVMNGPVGSKAAPETAAPTKFTDIILQHLAPTSTSLIDPAGVASLSRNGVPLTFIDTLEIFLGPSGAPAQPRTADIRSQLADGNPAVWRNRTRIGEGGAQGDPLKENGTGPIRLDFLPGLTFAEGEYCIELRVDANTEAGKRVANGGKILYNLYIE